MPETRELIIPTDIQTAVTTEEATALAELARGKTVLEMGAWHGFSTVVLASVAQRVYSVDWHMGDDHAGIQDTWNIFIGNLAKYGVAERVTIYRGRFEVIIPRLAEGGVHVDGAFLDGMHDRESVERDVALALTLIKPGGFLAFHDFGRGSATGHPGFEVTEVASGFGIDSSVGFLGWGFVPLA